MMKSFRSKLIFILMMVTQLSAICYAQNFSGPLAQASGGAGRGAADEGEQILLNPAAIVHSSSFTSAFIYQDGYQAANEHDRVLGLSLADNSENLIVSGGYAYFKRRSTFANFNTYEQDYHQASIGRFIFRQLALGLTVQYTKTDIIGDKTFEQWDGHVGLHYNPNADFGLGLVFYNVGNRDIEAPKEIQNLDKAAIGVHYIAMPMFRIRLDLLQQLVANSSNKTEVQFGVASQFREFLFTRLGYNHDPLLNRNYYTVGLGFDGPRLKIDYYYRKNEDYAEGGMHGVSMRMPFW